MARYANFFSGDKEEESKSESAAARVNDTWRGNTSLRHPRVCLIDDLCPVVEDYSPVIEQAH